LMLASVLEMTKVVKWNHYFIIIFIFIIPSILAYYYWNAVRGKYDRN